MTMELRELLVTPTTQADKSYLMQSIQPMLRTRPVRSQWLNDESIFAIIAEGQEHDIFETLAPIVSLVDLYTDAGYSLRTVVRNPNNSNMSCWVPDSR